MNRLKRLQEEFDEAMDVLVAAIDMCEQEVRRTKQIFQDLVDLAKGHAKICRTCGKAIHEDKYGGICYRCYDKEFVDWMKKTLQ